MDQGNAQSKTACGDARQYTAGYVGKCQPPTSAPPQPARDPRTLDELINNAISYAAEVRDIAAQAGAIRERLSGPWPECASLCGEPPSSGMLSALDVFQRQAWSALNDLRGHLNAVGASLG